MAKKGAPKITAEEQLNRSWECTECPTTGKGVPGNTCSGTETGTHKIRYTD